MRTKLVYTAPVAVSDSLDEPVTDASILAALADVSCPDGTVLEYLGTDIPNQSGFRGGYLRLVLDGKRLRVRIEIDSPRKLKRPELADLREDLDGQVSDGIGEGGFEFVADATGLAIETFPNSGGNSQLVQTTGEAWRPGKPSAEATANRRRCRAAAAAAKAAERAADKKAAKGKGAKPDPKRLFRLIQQQNRDGVAAEIARLGGDLGFIKSGVFPFENLHDRPLLRLLLDAGLNPNLHDREGHPLLWLAAGREPCVSLLLDRGADPNLCNVEGDRETALMRAAWFGDAKSVRTLLDRGADPTLKTFFGKTALDEARKGVFGSSSPEVIRMLTQAMKRK